MFTTIQVTDIFPDYDTPNDVDDSNPSKGSNWSAFVNEEEKIQQYAEVWPFSF